MRFETEIRIAWDDSLAPRGRKKFAHLEMILCVHTWPACARLLEMSLAAGRRWLARCSEQLWDQTAGMSGAQTAVQAGWGDQK
ncbi:hypothetical protein SADO_14679 [Salinisphaera dokdonensis CL-ES53]|uniref:Transposase n=1 Tax=Salinisphaera dokdonensis CL-ES53 TaxID=1304272 RepID=A0ABV2B516_9GAMM